MRKVNWKGGARCSVSVGLNVAEVGGSAFALNTGVPLLLDLFERNIMRATFFVTEAAALTHPELVARIHRMGHEVGFYLANDSTTANGDRFGEDTLAPATVAGFRRGVATLNGITGVDPTGFRAATGPSELLDVARDLGMHYASTTTADIVPVTTSAGPLQVPVNPLLHDPIALDQGVPNAHLWRVGVEALESVWLEEFRGAYHYGGHFNLALSPEFIGRPGRLQMLDRVLAGVNAYPDVWTAPLRDVALHWREEYA